MTEMEKTLATGLVALFEKTINLEDTQCAIVRFMSVSLPCSAKQKRIFQNAVARAESASDQCRASLVAMKACLKKL